MQSAGTWLPSVRMTTSSVTMFLAGMVCSFPSRTTVQVGEVRMDRRSIFRLANTSVTMPKVRLSPKMTTNRYCDRLASE